MWSCAEGVPRCHGDESAFVEMTHLYDTVEPNVVSEALLRECVQAQGPPGEAGRVAREEGVAFCEVTALRLDFQNILCIDNLWQFSALRRLQLDNNIIEQISGLESLTQLEWLDLSFNNIEVIQGLENLGNLRDLSLANNRISTLGTGLKHLKNLQILSLANNLLNDLGEMRQLRSFKCLQSLTLRGNPFADEDDYPSFVVAFIPSLVYVDFQMITAPERSEACERFHETLEEVEMTEREEARKLEQKREEEEREELLRSAYVDGLDGSTLFHAMFEEDADFERLKKLPGGEVEEKLQTFEEEFVKFCEHLVKVGLEEKEKRVVELNSFKKAREQACSASQELSVTRVKQFEEEKAKLLHGGGGVEEVEAALERLQFSLMQLEMQLVEQLDDATKDFDRNFSDLFTGFLEQVQSHMTQLRELENLNHEAVTELATVVLERYIKNQLDEDLADDLRVLFVDKDTLLGAINAAHDLHMLAIDSKEDGIVSRSKKELKTILDEIQSAEFGRNRRKVAEIQQFIKHQREDLLEDTRSPTPH